MSNQAQALGQIAEIWLDPQHPLRKETVEALRVSTGLNQRQIELAFANCFEELLPPKINAYAASFDVVKRRHIDVFHILPANAFTAWVHGAVITLLSGHRCLLKPSSREPVFARAWKRSLEMASPELASQVDIVAWDENKLRACEAVVAYGADETLDKIRKVLRPGTRFAGYGHKLSIGILFEEALGTEAHEQLLSDIREAADPFRLQGCLSPQILYLQTPRSSLRSELEATLDVAPRVVSFEAWPSLSKELEKFNPYLSCVGYAGEKEREAMLARELSACQVSRVCPIGQMQRPPLSWQNGGIDLVNLLN